ncbi:MAG: PDZ domain-containing protein [Saprospiraceae bacterium]|nr:PDZ domain-containing protein [Saprospiraceae bacterium]
MKTTRILLLAISFLLFPWCASTLFAQQQGAQKVVITKRTVDADGSESSETIVKKGEAAAKFDVDKYIKDNRSDNTSIEIKVKGGDDERTIVVKGAKTVTIEGDSDDHGYSGYEGYEGYAGYQRDDKSTFLGVGEDSDENADQPGLVVEVIRGSAADRAGLRDNDKIMKLNDTPVNQWSDLSKFIKAAKSGDKVRISYERNGKAATTEATLTTRSEVKNNGKCEPRGFLGVSDEEENDENEEAGVTVSITEGSGADKAGLQDGDMIFQLGDTPIADFEDISDFMEYTKPGDKVQVVYERNGKRNTVEVTLSEQSAAWNLNGLNNLKWNDNNWGNFNWNNGNCTVDIREKDACLGVYSDAYTEAATTGARVNSFTDESAAREAQMIEGDVITAVEGQRVKGHDDLWNEIARHKVGDKVKVEYLREGKTMTVEATLKACRDNSSQVQIFNEEGRPMRNFFSWNWTEDDQRRLRERSIITIRRGEGDAPKVNATPPTPPAVQDRNLKLTNFRAYPNPTQGQVTVEFEGEPVATTVSFFDLSGRQLFREELNAFNGQYAQQFDLSAYAKGTILVHVQQGDKIFTEQLVVN